MTPAPPPSTPPAHVPPDLVRDIDPWEEIMKGGAEMHARAATFHEEYPPVFWANRLSFLGGCWVPRRSEDLRHILQTPDTFSSADLSGFSRLIGETWPLIPLEIDPPEHFDYRMLLNPLFTPKKVAELDESMRVLSRKLIADVADKGECDFNHAFAEQFPILIFLKLMGWPLEEAPKFVKWTQALVKGDDMVVVAGACGEIASYLRARIAQSRVTPSDDFTSYVIAADIKGRKLTDDEIMGMCFLIFIGGLDTVTSALGFQFMHLATHPEDQARLRAEPDLIPEAVEELLRAYSIVNMRRQVMKDVEIGGAPMKKGDFVLISTELANLDPEAFSDATKVDFDREDKRHVAFSYGVHRCVGSHLARRELGIAIQEWLNAVPQFHATAPDEIQGRAAGVFGVNNFRISWSA